MGTKKYGDVLVSWPIECKTGAEHAQPAGGSVSLTACCDLLDSDWTVMFDSRGALDAPEQIPSGGVRGQDFLGASGRLMVAHVYREGFVL